MHVLMLSWEYPPLVVGGIARHVHDLAVSLARQGCRVTVLTAGTADAPEVENRGGLTVHRIRQGHPAPMDLVGQVMQLNLDFLEHGLALAKEDLDLIHAHDWVTAYAAKALKHGLDLPLVATIHATEWGRNNGLHNDLHRYISNVEWWLAYEAWRVICCSGYMEEELRRIFQLPGDKLCRIPNGVFPEEFAAGPLPPGFRDKYAAPDEKIVFHVGRLVREKGLDVLLDAMPLLLARYPQAKLVIAGRGGHASELAERAKYLGIYNRVYFTGYIDDGTRNLLYRAADVAVFPSLYEPFGIVALEAMAAGAPLIVSDTGGLSEVVVHGRNGLQSRTGDPVSLAENIRWLLEHPEEADRMRRQAGEDVRRLYNWDEITRRTREVYQDVLGMYAPLRRENLPLAPWKLSREARDAFDRYGDASA